MLIRLIKAVVIIWFGALALHGQGQSLSFDNNLVEVIEKLEQQTNLIFNYDPTLLKQYRFQGQIRLDQENSFLKEIFFDTPLSYELSNDAVLVFLDDKQTFRICGNIQDQKGKFPLSFANVYLDDGRQGTQTNDEGSFDTEFQAYKNQIVSISYIGYRAQSFRLDELASKGCPQIFLEVDADIFDSEIIITDYLIDGVVEGEAYNSIQMDYGQLANTYTNIENDILKSVQLLPGIHSTDETATNIQIRGATADQNLVLWEGATLYDAGHLFGMISSVNPFVVDEVKVFKGIFSPNYDNRVGGIIDMSLTDSLGQDWHAGLGTTLTEAHSYLEAPIIPNKLMGVFAGRKTLNGFVETPTLNAYSARVFQATKVEEEQDADNDQVLEFYDFNGKLLFRPVEELLLKASYFQSSNQFDYSANFAENNIRTNDNVNSRSEVFSFSGIINWNDQWQNQISYTQSNYQNDYRFKVDRLNDLIQLENLSSYNDILDESIFLRNYFRFSPFFKTEIGYEYNQKQVNFNYIADFFLEEDFSDINLLQESYHNIFGSIQYQKPGFQLDFGLRATQFIEGQEWRYSPRLNIQAALSPSLKFKFSAGILQQYISQLKEFGENDLGINNSVWILSASETNSSLEAQKIAAGFVFRKNKWLIDIEAYYNKTDGLSTLSPLFGSRIEVPDFSNGESEARGIDLLVKKRWGNFSSWLNYSLSNTSYFFAEIDDFPFPSSNDQRHNLSFINSYKLDDWILSLNYQFRSGLPFTQAVEILEFEEDDEDVYYEIEYGEINELRLNNYGRLDLSLSYRPSLKNSKIQSEFAFSFINVLGRENLFSREYFLDAVVIDEEEDIEEVQIFRIDKFLLERTVQFLARFYW